MKQKIDMSMKSGAVTVKAEPLVIDLDEDKFVDGPADAMAIVLKEAVANQPGKKWDQTGHLRGGIRADGGDVVVPSDRLQRAELRERFQQEVVPVRITEDPRVKRAIQRSLDEAVGGKP